MTETDALKAALVRALERHAPGHWGAADTEWVDDRVRHALGETANAESALARRYGFVLQRLAERSADASTWAERLGSAPVSGAWTRRMAVLGVLVAVGAGMAADAVGQGGRIALLAPPLFALLAWNALVYAAWLGAASARLWQALRARSRHRAAAAVASARPADGSGFADALARLVRVQGPALLERLGRRGAPAPGAGGPSPAITTRRERASVAAARRATAARWLRPVWQARATVWLHAAAAGLATGAIAGLYLRGFGFEYRAVWDSTFLDPPAARALLGWVLGPATALTGITLPDGEAFAALRGSVGNGANAAPWIHLWAVTLVGAVVLPRLLLAAAAWRSARGHARQVPLPWEADPWLDDLRRRSTGDALRLWLVPHRWRPEPSALQRLQAQAKAMLRRPAEIAMAPTVAEGDEDHPAAGALHEAPQASHAMAWVRLSATPEQEVHGRLLARLGAGRTAAAGLLVDEAGYGQGFASQEAVRRRTERRAAWTALSRQLGATLVFVDSAGEPPASGTAGVAHAWARELSATAAARKAAASKLA